MTRLGAPLIGSLYRAACLAELDALKPGNVHAYSAGHRMAVADFVTSADVSAPALARAGAGVGERVRDAVAATMRAVGQNTNLGILLLCAPLAAAAERGCPVATVIGSLDAADSEAVFAGIRLANPGGLGRAGRHDVTAPAPGCLLDAMAEAADRDRIARAYVTGFDDLREIGRTGSMTRGPRPRSISPFSGRSPTATSAARQALTRPKRSAWRRRRRWPASTSRIGPPLRFSLLTHRSRREA
jgi:triphosphoribosyl-dephospho-CoA synthase